MPHRTTGRPFRVSVRKTARPPADPSETDDLVAEFRRFEERTAAEAVRFSRWADEIAAAGPPREKNL